MSQTLIQLLTGATVNSMVASGCSQQDFLSGPIVHTDMYWQAPPLNASAKLMRQPLKDYLEKPTWVNVERLYELWTDALGNLRNKPTAVINEHGQYRNASYAMPNIRNPERNLRLSTPDGWPHQISEYTGVTLSIECAHLLRTNSKLKSFVFDENNYYAILPDDREVGVKNGVPAVYEDEWDLSVEGMVPELLDTPRGLMFEGCDYNIISKCRSLLYENKLTFPEKEGLELALQALRILRAERDLLDTIQGIRSASKYREVRLRRLRDAVDVSMQFTMSDRARLQTLRSLLVPEVMSAGEFTKQVYSYSGQLPVMLATKTLERIRLNMAQLLKEEEERYAIEN